MAKSKQAPKSATPKAPRVRTPKGAKAVEPTKIEKVEEAVEQTEELDPRMVEVSPGVFEFKPDAAAEVAGPVDAPAKERAPALGKSVIPAHVKKQYAGGTCGDGVAMWLANRTAEGYSPEQVGAVNGVPVEGRWGHLNPGMRRMNLGNVLRRLVAEGHKLVKPEGKPDNKPAAAKPEPVLVAQAA